MAEKKTDKSLFLCTLSCIISFACYGLERLVQYQHLSSSSVMLALAFIFTALTGLVFFMIFNIKNPLQGLFASIFAFKLMPVAIPNLINFNLEATALYSIVKMAGLVLFALLIYKHFNAQKLIGKELNVLPVIALVFTMAMLREPASDLYTSLYYLLNKSLYGVYFAQAFIYLWSCAIIYVTTIKSNDSTIKFISAFQITAMIVNIVRRLGAIMFCIINQSHISASYYCWILIYVIVMVGFAIQYKKVNKKALNEQ